MTLVERMGFIQVAATENFGVRVTEKFFPEQSANRVVHCIAHNRRHNHQRHHQMNIEIIGRQRRKRTSNKQQRVSRQERCHHQPGFAEQDQKQNRVYPDTVFRDQLRQVHINVQDKINKKVNQVHSYAFIRLKLVRQK